MSFNAETIPDLMGPEGPLAKIMDPYEDRPFQREMALEVARLMDAGGTLAIEAPTGIGKSLGYGLPASVWARDVSGPVVVSTFTKALQEQLLRSEAPRLKQILGPELNVRVLKGRTNYLCYRRFETERRAATGTGTVALLERLRPWVDTTETGDFAECGEKDSRDLRFLALRVSSDPQFCAHRGCTPEAGCFYKKARREAADADLLVVNHALLAIELFQGARLLPSFESLIIDEAHAFLTTSLDHLTLRVGVRRLRGIRDRLPGPATPPFLKEGEGEARWQAVKRAVKGLEACEPYFGGANGKKPGGDPRQTYESQDELDILCPAGFRKVAHGLGTLDADVAVLEAHMSSHPEADHPHALGFAASLARFRDEVVGARQDLDQLLNPDQADREVVHWKEWSGDHFDLCRSPLEVGPHLTPALMRGPTRVVFTSATLSTGEDFGFFSRETGLGERLHAVAYPSPFAYEEQSAVIALQNGLDPRDPGFPKSTAKVLGDLVQEPNRKTLALFTSYRDLTQTGRALSAHPALQESTILAQGEGQSPAELLERFRQLPHGVLLGTASFWQGIDLPGDALEILVMTRLPFGVPTDPRLKARSERVEEAGGNAFMDLYLPEAVLKFKQGFGRLIRRRSDRGVVLVLDPRLLGKGYGRRFAKALPVPIQEATSLDDLVKKTRTWWASGSLETETTV